MAGRVVDIRTSAESSDASIRFRTATLRDTILLRGLQRRCFSGSQAYGLATLLVLYFWPRSQILIACAGEHIVGCVVGDTDGTQARVLNLCVDPNYRRRGVATTLLNAIESRLGAPYVTLMVEDKNLGAQALYRVQGYLPVSDLRNYYGRNRHGILMQKHRSN